MALFNCEYFRKSEIHENCDDNSYEITRVYPLEGYDNVNHLVGFIKGSNIFNICESKDHGSAQNALTERFGIENTLVLYGEKGKYWRVSGHSDSLSSLKSLRTFLLSLQPRINEESSMVIDNINHDIEAKTYKVADYDELLQQVNVVIDKKEEELRQKAEELVISEIIHQLEERKKKSFAEKVKGYLCGK